MPDEAYWGTFFNPECIVRKLDCSGLFDVVEFGCGFGLFTIPVAGLVSGTVYALDIDPQMIAATASHARDAGMGNVAPRLQDFVAQGCGRPDRSAGYAMLFNILHIEEPVALLREAYRVLAPGGKVGVIHWKHDEKTPRGPSLKIRPKPEECRQWAEEAGLVHVRDEDLCCCSWHWGMVLERPGAPR